MPHRLVTKPCRKCSKPMENVRTNRKYCSSACRTSATRKIQRGLAKGREHNTYSEELKDMISLAFSADSLDVIRDVFREEIRQNISQAVHDNILGAAEVMTHMLPKTLAALNNDLESQDWMVRSRAQALVLKYSMAFKEADTSNKDLGVLRLVHGAAVPDTPLGERVADYVVNHVEPFEESWPVCCKCKVRKHPEAMNVQSGGWEEGNIKVVCKSCEARKSLMRKSPGQEIGVSNDLDNKFYG